jgi:hypothetical protein
MHNGQEQKAQSQNGVPRSGIRDNSKLHMPIPPASNMENNISENVTKTPLATARRLIRLGKSA